MRLIKTFLKSVPKSLFVKRILCKLTYYYINLVYKINHWQIIYSKPLVLDKPAIYVFWHGRLIMMPHLCPKGLKMNVLISDHSDGILISNVMRHFGFDTICGSTSKNATHALREILTKLKLGQSIAITPDGPRGPAFKINSNLISIAKMTGVPIVPISFSCTNAWIFRSWDKFILPKPFGKGVLIYGKQMLVAKNCSASKLKEAETELEKEMIAITERADELCGKII